MRNLRYKSLKKQHTNKFSLDNGVMETPKRRLFTFIFASLCFGKSLLIKNLNFVKDN